MACAAGSYWQVPRWLLARGVQQGNANKAVMSVHYTTLSPNQQAVVEQH